MDIQMRQLSNACDYLCNLQNLILNQSNDLSFKLQNSNEMEVFYNHWDCYIKSGLLFIKQMINHYSTLLTIKMNYLTKLSSIELKGNIDKIIDTMELYEQYIKLIYQIKLEIDYLDTGAICCKGHMDEMVLFHTTMNRSKDLKSTLSNNICKSYIRGEDETHQQKYSCLSLDGIRVLYTQFKITFKDLNIIRLPTNPDSLYDPQVDNMNSLRRRVMNELCNKEESILSTSKNPSCLFNRKNMGNYDHTSLTMKISYSIVR
jgi:hypothetical protein